MNAKTISRFSASAAIAIMASAVNLSTVTPVVADINVGALSCQPTYNTEPGLLWHQHYVINPPTAAAERWVVCNIPFEADVLPEHFFIGAFGLNDEGHSNVTSLCYANVVDIRNQNVPTKFGPTVFLDNPGQDMSYTKIMQTKTKVDYLWSSWVSMSKSAVISGMMSPPPTPINQAGAEGSAFWTITINCKLKPGQALNMVSLWPTNSSVP